MNKQVNKAFNLINRLSKMELGCSPSVGLMDNIVLEAREAIEEFYTLEKPKEPVVEAHIDISPGSDKRCCENCKSFTKFGVHLGFCSEKEATRMDNRTCKKFELQIEKREEL